MDIQTEIEKKERELNELRSKANQVQALEEQKKAIEQGLDTEQQKIEDAREQLEKAKQYAIDKLAAQRVLEARKAKLAQESREYVIRVNKELGELQTEINDITLSVGGRLEQSFMALWKLENKPLVNQSVDRSYNGSYNVDAIAQGRARDRKMHSAYSAFYTALLQEASR